MQRQRLREGWTAQAPRICRLATVGAFLVAALLGVHGAKYDTPTVDEFAHLPAGCALWRYGSFHHYAHNPPLGKLLISLPVVLSGARVPPPPGPPGAGVKPDDWAPWDYGQRFMEANAERYFALYFRARLVVLASFLVGGLLLYQWSRRLWGERAALLAVVLYLFCPNLQAHARLATLDVLVTVAILAAFFALHRYLEEPSVPRLALTGLLGGVAVLTKFTALLALPLLVTLFLAGLRGTPLRRRLLRLGGLLSISLLVIHLGYGLRQPWTRLAHSPLDSRFGQTVARLVPDWVPIPLPDPMVHGLDAQKLALERGEFGNYLLGTWTTKGSPAHNLVALLVKIPIATQLLFWMAIVILIRAPCWRAEPLTECFIWAWPVLVLLAFTLGGHLDVGVRYLLPALPFAFLGIARIGAATARSPAHPAGTPWKWITIAVPSAAGALLVTTVLSHPHQLSFFNRLAGGPANGHRFLLDSNIDWGQDLGRVPDYLARHHLDSVYLLYFGHVEPGMYGIRYALPPAQAAPGTYIVSVNFAQGYSYLAPDHGAMGWMGGGAPRWLRELTPVDRIAYSLWVYRVP